MKFFWLLIPFCLLFSACSEKEEETFKPQTLEDFYPKYNRYISDWLVGQRKELEAKLEEERDRLAEVEDEQARQLVQSEVEELERALGRIAYREKLGDYFAFKDPSELPEGLTWEDGMDEPEIGDPAAKKGGVFRYYIPNFPATLRGFGSESNNGFRSEIYDNISMALVGLHPDTLKVIPALAREWAVSEDGHTVYFKLDPDATYTDGVRVRAKDFMWAIFLRVSDNVTTPYEKQYYREQFGQICVYDEETLSVTLADAQADDALLCEFAAGAAAFFRRIWP